MAAIAPPAPPPPPGPQAISLRGAAPGYLDALKRQAQAVLQEQAPNESAEVVEKHAEAIVKDEHARALFESTFSGLDASNQSLHSNLGQFPNSATGTVTITIHGNAFTGYLRVDDPIDKYALLKGHSHFIGSYSGVLQGTVFFDDVEKLFGASYFGLNVSKGSSSLRVYAEILHQHGEFLGGGSPFVKGYGHGSIQWV